MSTPPPLLPSHSAHDGTRPESPRLGSPAKSTSAWSPVLVPRPKLPSPEDERDKESLYSMKERHDLESASKGEKPADLPKQGKRATVSAATIVPIWIALSSAVILYNKYLYSTLEFPYPIFITSYHLGCAALGTRILRATTNLMDGLDNIKMTRELYLRSILPIGILFSGSLILSNTAYLTLSVSFIQMLKAFTPVAILLISAIFRIQALNQRLVLIVILISVGCALAAYGEVHFELYGFVCQASAVIFESSRLVMIQILLQGLKMDPLCSLHYYAPVCAIINACFLPFTEGLAPFQEFMRVGPLIMLSNAAVAFGLNVAAVFLIGAAGGLVLTLAGVFKDILLITSSCLFFGSTITSIQVFGYSLALGGLVAYKSASSKS
ncbi:triose-phosphate transporter family-domain-containing protein [Papiliotrema laurentii]|uniref:Triose-phosphate transporter family-domain-containing protein n=1 Tax=Papiliotrema laurentii TaxID=5418 RepID=A0AAD9FRB3_PAPLA|nr:triose-phosphate transporter family-domain-containing protein [Papiliotrema laurentii]